MELRPLGRTGVRVPVLCLGTMTFGLQSDEEASCAILDRAHEAGVDFLDTADVYPLGGSLETVGRTEEILGRWMRDRRNRDSIFLATKCRGRTGSGPNDQGVSRYHVQRAVEESLRRLGTEVIDLYQVHSLDLHAPHDETLRAFDDLVRAGKVRYIGCSNYPAWRVAEALGVSAQLELARYETVQPRYNLLYREIETELLPLCRSAKLGVLVYNPLAGGMLSGKYTRGEAPRDGTRFTLGKAGRMYQYRYWQEAQLEAVEKLCKESELRNVSPVTVALAWVMAQEGVTSAIIGASRVEQLAPALAAPEFELDEDLRSVCDTLWFGLPRRPVIEGYR